MADDTTLTCAQLAAALDDVLDGLFPDGENPVSRPAVDAHLAACPACRLLAADVRAIRATARTLEPMTPPPAVWAAVRARVIEPPAAGRRVSTLDHPGAWSTGWGAWFQPAAAAAVLVLVASSLAWMGTRLGETTASGGGRDIESPTEFALAEAEYSDAIARLEEATAEAPPGLDDVTTATLRASIDDIDTAIGEAREALAQEPGDEWSQESLLVALGSKVALLQDTVALLGEAGNGTEERNP
ncbi:MAG TPA: hypothetical protein VNN99_17915 [Vicinamibacterales bacterium]|nr:hypothetical protein [Vicinamibacterales bacterium]HXR43910.1 hypothetical protein [Pseudolysinimonas sp.]